MTRTAEPTSWIGRVSALLGLSRFPEAEQAARQGLIDDPANAQGLGLLTLALLGQAKAKEALAVADRHVAVAPDAEWPHRQRSAALAHLGKRRAAVDAARESVRLAPRTPEAHINAAARYLEAGALAQANEHAELARSLGPESTGPLYVLALVRTAMGESQEAGELYTEILKRDPLHASALLNLGALRLKAGERKAADDLFTRAGRANASNPKPGLNLAMTARRRVRMSHDNASLTYLMRNGVAALLILLVYEVFDGTLAAASLAVIALLALATLNLVVAERRTNQLPPLQRQLLRDQGWRSWRHPFSRARRSIPQLRSELPGFTIATVLSWLYLSVATTLSDSLLALVIALMMGLFFARLVARSLRNARMHLIRLGWWPTPQ